MAENAHFKLDIKVTRGDTRTVPIEFLDSDGGQEDVSLDEFFYTAKKSIKDSDEDAAILIEPSQIVAVVNPVVKNKINIILTELNTNLEPGDYHHDIQRKNDDGILTIGRGFLTIEDRVTIRTAALDNG